MNVKRNALAVYVSGEQNAPSAPTAVRLTRVSSVCVDWKTWTAESFLYHTSSHKTSYSLPDCPFVRGVCAERDRGYNSLKASLREAIFGHNLSALMSFRGLQGDHCTRTRTHRHTRNPSYLPHCVLA
ncbi:hypothetical protein J6590_065944 [Homalodisca vitripennis]|nr:hypothetical protein J6590_065944 [Homalodisca vitripennis]